MRVLHVIPSLAQGDGGPSAALSVMERALTAEGVSVVTVTTDDDGPGRHNDFTLEEPHQQNGVVRHYFRKQTEFYKVSLGMRSWLNSSSGHWDLWHIHSLFSFTSVAAMRAARRAGIPYVVRPLGVLARYGMTQRRALLKRMSLRWLESPLLRDAAAVHFTDETERDEALAWGFPMKPVVIPLGLEPLSLPPADPRVAPSVLFMSRLDPKKNVESLLEAWAQVHPVHPAWRLVIAGEGTQEYETELKRRSAQLGVASSIDWAGHVAGNAKVRSWANAKIFVLPSFSENFGLAAAEALLAGKASVLAPGVAVAKSAASAGAACLAEPTPAGIFAALDGLMAEERRREAMGRRARAFAESEFSSDVLGRRLCALYQELTRGQLHEFE